MKALVKHRRGDGFVDLSEVPEPRPTHGEALVKVEYAGICGSDLNILHGTFPGYNVPVIIGHEFSGIIEGGSASLGFEKGQRVACETHAVVCGDCFYCRTGVYNLCASRKGFGYGVDGAFTKYVKVRRGIIHPLPDGLSTQEAALLEPLSVAVNALTVNSRITAGDSIVILGPGPIGMMCLLIAKLSGAEITVVGTERSGERLRIAEKLGASTMTQEELGEVFEGPRGHGGFDVSVVAAGKALAFQMGLKAVRPQGRVVLIGESTEDVKIPLATIERKNLSVRGSFSHNWPVWERAISLLDRKLVDVKPLITHRFPLVEWSSAFEVTERRKGMKVLIRP
jgi:L-iditol 2-dehydrogenase